MKKPIIACILILAALLPSAQANAATVVTSVTQESYYNKDLKKILEVHSETPLLPDGPKAINNDCREAAEKFVGEATGKYYSYALEESDLLMEMGLCYSFKQGFQATYNANGYISILSEDNSYLAGAHSTSVYRGATYDLKTGAKLSLDDIVVDTKAALEKLYIKAEAYVKENGFESFYEGPIEAVYDKNDFVLAPSGIEFFFQEYSIAPYSMGRPAFIVKYEDLGALKAPIKPIKGNSTVNEIRSALPLLLTAEEPLSGDYVYALSDVKKASASIEFYVSGFNAKAVGKLFKIDGNWELSSIDYSPNWPK